MDGGGPAHGHSGHGEAVAGVAPAGAREPAALKPECQRLVAGRSFTVGCPRVALAMVKGFKRMESKSKTAHCLAAGWYYVHVGSATLPAAVVDKCAAAIQSTWPEAPEASTLPRSCIYGAVLLGKVVDASALDDPWAFEELPKAHVILETREFRSPVPNLKGKQNVWCNGE